MMDPEDVGADLSAIADQTTDTDSGGNPAWQELFDVMPTNLHQQIRPVLEKWEQGTQAKFNEYAEKSKAYEPYEPLISSQIPVDQIEQALQVAALIDSDPQGFLAQMQAVFGGQEQQPQPQQYQQGDPADEEGMFDEQPFDIESDPRFQQLQQQQDIIANFLAQQAQAEESKQADQMLEQELTSLTEKYGDFDERYVITLAASGMEIEDAVKQYQEIINTAKNTPRADANLPNILTPGGGVPSSQVNVAELSETDRKKLVMNMLAQANKT